MSCTNCGASSEDVKWQRDQAYAKLDRVCKSWEGTPYKAGGRVRGAGVDCVLFVVSVLDAMFDRDKPTKIPKLSPDAGIHSARAGFSTVRAIREGFPSDVVRDGTIEPGDVLVMRAEPHATAARRLGHVLIAGSQKNTAYHAINTVGVCRTSIAANDIIRVYRPRDKDQW